MSISPKGSIYKILVVLLVTLVHGVFEVEGFTSNLHRRWTINFPSVTLIQSNNTIIVDYGMSEELSSENVRTKIFTDSCEGPDLTLGILEDTIDSITGAHIFQIDIPALIRNEEVTTIDISGQNATMRFCLMYSLWSGGEENSIQINYIYNILNVFLDTAHDIRVVGFLIDETDDDDLSMGDRHDHHEKEKHFLNVYLCDPITHEPTSAPLGGYGMGDVLSICATASQSIIDDAMYLKGVDNFLWRRTVWRGGVAIVTEQWAVKDGVSDPVSTYNCPMYALLCTFTSILNAEFFVSEGFVEGIGSAALAFGTRKLGAVNTHFDDKQNKPANNMKKTNLRSLEQQQQQQASSADNSNMAISIPIKGPRVRPLKNPVVETGTKQIPSWALWLITAILVSVSGLGVYLYWRESYRGNGVKT